MARSEISSNADKESFFNQQIVKQSNYKNSSPTVNKGSSSYLSQPNVKEFNKEMQKRVFNSSGVGRPYAFASVEELENNIQEYFDLCTDKQVVPTVTSLALWLGVNKDTIYAHANNPNSPFSDIIKNCITYLHSIMQNGTIDGKINPVTYIFISKNDYSMRDDKNIQVTAQGNSSPVNNQETMSAIQKQIEEENISNAEFSEK